PYNPAGTSGTSNTCRRYQNHSGAYIGDPCEISIRVRVCVADLLEPNCKPYGNNWKPEGTLQEYSDRMRYAAFGYLNDHDAMRDGGVLRSEMKFIGPMKPDGAGLVPNDDAEWNEAPAFCSPTRIPRRPIRPVA